MEYDRPHKTGVFSLSDHMSVRIYDKAGIESLGQALRVPDPEAGLAFAGRLIMAQFFIELFNQLDAIAQRRVDRVGGFALEVREVVQATDPMTLAVEVAKVTSIVRRLEQTVMRAVAILDHVLHQ